MKFSTPIAAAAVTAVAALGFAAAAQADPLLLNGSYTGDGGADEFLWTFATSCAGNVCTGTVGSNQGWQTPAQFVNGEWHFIVTKPDGVICPDGRYAPAYISVAVDPATLAGNVTTDSNFGCPGGHVDHAPFKLIKVG